MTRPALTDEAGIAAALDANPVFHMSLGSKELFHSNFLWWLARTHRDVARAVFGAWTEDDAAQTVDDVTREGNDLDVVFRMAGFAPLVVENKVFSLPDLEQLEEYAEKKIPKLVPRGRRGATPRKPPRLVLLTMADPGWPDDIYRGAHGTWRLKRYSDLCGELASHVEGVASRSPYDGQTLAHYCKFVSTLCDLHELVRVRSNDEPVDLDDALLEPLEKCRIADGVKKLRMHDVERLVKNRVASEAPTVAIEVNLTNKMPLVEGFCSLDGVNDLGWQYQDGAFRLAMRVNQHRGKTDDADAVRRAFVRSHPAWFDFARATAILGPHIPTDPRRAKVAAGDFHKYEHFLYRPHRPARISVAQLLDLASHYSQEAVTYAATLSR